MAHNAIDFGSRGVVLQKQAELAWCYAAVISIVSNWLTNNNGWNPCQIVAANLEVKLGVTQVPDTSKQNACNCCRKNKPSACTGVYAVGGIGPTCNRMGITYHRGNGMPSSALVAQEIDNNRPVLVALARSDGNAGHVALIIGYDDAPRPGDNDRTDMFTLYDPAAINIPIFNGRVNVNSMTLMLTMNELYAKYPSPKYSVKNHYTQLALAPAGLTPPPNWAVFQDI
jgi:hypothetical protein